MTGPAGTASFEGASCRSAARRGAPTTPAVRAGHRRRHSREEEGAAGRVHTMRVGNLPPGRGAPVSCASRWSARCRTATARLRSDSRWSSAPRLRPRRSRCPDLKRGSGVAADTDAVPRRLAPSVPPTGCWPGFPTPVRLGIRVTVARLARWRRTRSAPGLHTVVEEEDRQRPLLPRRAGRAARPRLYFALAGSPAKSVGTSLVVKPRTMNREGTFLLNGWCRRLNLGEKVAASATWCFVLEPIRQACSGLEDGGGRGVAVSRMVETLTETRPLQRVRPSTTPSRTAARASTAWALVPASGPQRYPGRGSFFARHRPRAAARRWRSRLHKAAVRADRAAGTTLGRRPRAGADHRRAGRQTRIRFLKGLGAARR